jgi:hypothetical protein
MPVTANPQLPWIVSPNGRIRARAEAHGYAYRVLRLGLMHWEAVEISRNLHTVNLGRRRTREEALTLAESQAADRGRMACAAAEKA